MSTRAITFFHRGRLVEVTDVAPTRTVLQWLREDARCTGTKEGCAEGDCGACTVIVGEPARGGKLELQSVNACIRFLPTLDGKALFTVEDVRDAGGNALHPVQQAMVDCHGSQCGFCTPGFVMSLAACYERFVGKRSRGDGLGSTGVPTRQQLADEIAGNLCRCTGYRPILDAGERMFELPVKRLRGRRGAPRPCGHCHAARSASLRRARWCPVAAIASSHRARLSEFARLRLAHPQARLLAGATDIGLWVNKQMRDVGDMVYIGEVAELKRITRQRRRAVDRRRRVARRRLGCAGRARARAHRSLAALRVAADPPHAGTMGGNVANGSPIGDSAPVLIALDAQHRAAQGRRGAPHAAGRLLRRLHEATACEPGEFVQAIEVPLAAFESPLRAYKISKRFDSDISAVFVAVRIRLERRHGARRALRVRRHGGDGQARDGGRTGGAGPALERGDAAACHRRAGARFHAVDRSACQRAYRLTVARQPAAPLLARDAHERRAAGARGVGLGPRGDGSHVAFERAPRGPAKPDPRVD